MIGGQQKSKSVVDLDIGQGLIDSLGFVIAFGAPCRARLFLVRRFILSSVLFAWMSVRDMPRSRRGRHTVPS